MNRPRSLQLDDRPDLHQRGWWIQRIIWVLLALFIAAGAVGIFGSGLLSKQTLGEKNANLWLEYDRFARKEAPMELEFHITAQGQDTIVLQLPAGYLRHFQVESISPAPGVTLTHNGHVAYKFPAKGPITVLFNLKPSKMGSVQGSIMVNNRPFELNHFIYP